MSQHYAIGMESKILDIHWVQEDDIMKMLFTLEMSKDPVTSWIALSTLASIYDPLGVIEPLFMKARLISQKLSLKGKNCNDSLEKDLEVWNKWIQDLKKAKQIEFNPVLDKVRDTPMIDRGQKALLRLTLPFGV